MTKHKQYAQRMLKINKSLFSSFKKLHDKYEQNPDKWQEKFNTEGEKVLQIIREYENKLCSQSEKGGYSKFTPKLAEKFQSEIKKQFPLIDHIGLKVKIFTLKKINLP